MNDRERLTEMLKRAGIEFKEIPNDSETSRFDSSGAANSKLREAREAIKTDRVILIGGGYSCFWSELQFDEGGNLKAVTAWE